MENPDANLLKMYDDFEDRHRAYKEAEEALMATLPADPEERRDYCRSLADLYGFRWAMAMSARLEVSIRREKALRGRGRALASIPPTGKGN